MGDWDPDREPLILAEMEYQREHGYTSPVAIACACVGGPQCCLIRFEAARRLRAESAGATDE